MLYEYANNEKKSDVLNTIIKLLHNRAGGSSKNAGSPSCIIEKCDRIWVSIKYMEGVSSE